MEINGLDEHNEVGSDDEDALWSIEDDTLFQPCGLISHSSSSNNKTKSVFVTWNEHYLLNYRFKRSKKTNRMEMTKVRIPLPRNTHVRSIHMLEYNTLLLMSDGRVHCFGSIKSLHAIAWLKGVRSFARTNDGFSVIRHDEDAQQLLLQVYVDLPSLDKGESTLLHSYDITYDEQNIFQCDWRNDDYSLLTVTVAQQHLKFMQCLFGAGASADKQLHIFSVSGHVFALLPRGADEAESSESSEQAYHIELLCIYATSVKLMHLLPAQNLCLVYLSGGNVDIWYMSNLLGIKQRQMHYTGGAWLDYDASSENSDLYYTDGQELVRLRFEYNAILDDCQVLRCAKPVPGMQACTWVQHIEQLVCLSDNNIFYRIAFSLKQLTETEENAAALSDLTPAAIEQLRGNAQILQQYEQQPVELLAAIQREQEKQQLIAVARNQAYLESGLTAKLEYRRHLPLFGEDVLLLHTARQTDLDSSGIYAILQLTFHNSHKLLHSSHWQLVAYHGNEAHVHRVPTDLLLSRKCHIIIPLKKVCNERLPEFTLKLVAFLELHTETTAVLLPLVVQEDSDTYRALFGVQLHSLNLYNKYHLADMLSRTTPNKTKAKMQQKLETPGKLSLEQIAEMCNASGRIENNQLELYFIDNKLSIASCVEENKTILTLQSEDASALYHLKQHLFLNVDPKFEQVAPAEEAKQKLLKLQHEIERFYGTQCDDEQSEANVEMHLEYLLLKYNALRNTIF
ncbi:uncharacterized protein LOC116805739 [Drosophila grimshawi]|uniref:uncharacterized protein LOC116805739 n=1 Tax=Drosophila grimshawi TaxID=7222 RepID=UPI000C870214|nr:uncharacterized protein LOC116805739 [Drosophila grimshawi]